MKIVRLDLQNSLHVQALRGLLMEYALTPEGGGEPLSTEALERFKRGELAMIPPTIRNLEFLVPHNTADEALAAAMKVGIPPAIIPRLRVNDEGKVTAVVMPDEPGYDELPD